MKTPEQIAHRKAWRKEYNKTYVPPIKSYEENEKNKEKARLKSRAYRLTDAYKNSLANPERQLHIKNYQREYHKQYIKTEKYQKYQEEYRATHTKIIKPRKPKMLKEEISRKHRDYLLEYNYGLTREQYNKLYDSQNGCCAICGKTDLDSRTKQARHSGLVVDHDHKTNKVRFLLCTNCNTGLGKFNDDVSLLRKAADCLEKFYVSQ